ncbi:MAG: bacteriocin [Deltaproteobacteria bacterium]|nr:bacteriocin [Deltaproteobacteria bacterium]
MKTLNDQDLATISGGMRLDDLPESQNIEDRRGMTPYQSMHVKSPPAAPLPPLQRTPNDLSHQAGLDDIKIPRRR